MKLSGTPHSAVDSTDTCLSGCPFSSVVLALYLLSPKDICLTFGRSENIKNF